MKEANREVLDAGSLPALLADRARHSSDLRLAIDAALGLLLCAMATLFQPPFWLPSASLTGCLGLYGLWGILEREIVELPPGVRRRRILAASQALVMMLGIVAVGVFGFSLLAVAIGPVIS